MTARIKSLVRFSDAHRRNVVAHASLPTPLPQYVNTTWCSQAAWKASAVHTARLPDRSRLVSIQSQRRQ